jgi:hypothetical protein
LKLLVGEAFEKDHWRALFAMIKLPKEVSFENLKFKHFMEAYLVVIEK